LKITPKRYQDPVLWAWLEIFFSPKRYQLDLHNTLSPVIFFQLNALTGTPKVPAVDLLRLNTLIGDTKSVFLTPKRYEEHPCHFYMGVPPHTRQ